MSIEAAYQHPLLAAYWKQLDTRFAQVEEVFEGQPSAPAEGAASDTASSRPAEVLTLVDGSMTSRSRVSDGGGGSDRSSATGGGGSVNMLMNSSIYIAKVTAQIARIACVCV